MNLICLIAGHRWWIDESTTTEEPVFHCTRCGRKHVGPVGTGVYTAGEYVAGRTPPSEAASYNLSGSEIGSVDNATGGGDG